MSRTWFSSVIKRAPSSAHTVLPAPSTTLRVWLGPSLTAPDPSSMCMMRFLSACVWYAQDACYSPLAQTVNSQDSHEKSECIAGAGPARGLRGGGAPPVLHQGGGGALPDPVGGKPAGPGARGPARSGALPAAPPRARAYRRRQVLLRFRRAGPDHHARRHGPPARAGGEKRPFGHHHALVRGPLAHPAPRRLHTQPSRG